MQDWTAGYVAEIGYTHGYYHELNPLRARLAFANAGVVFPEISTACELGFGQGLSVNMHAAGSAVQWHGTDFNPAQAAFARDLAVASGAAAHLRDDAFAEFANRADLPDFDYIGLHGIWSWINDQNRHTLVDFIRRKLKVGGVLYVSYNVFPGWATFAPLRHLLLQHATVMGAEGHGITRRIDASLEFADRLMATEPLFAKANPLARERLEFMRNQNREYLAHEFFNRDWHPMPFATMAEWLEPAKLGFVASAHLLDHVDSLNLLDAQRDLLRDISDPMFRETVRDFITNQQFRKEYWVKGLRRVSHPVQMQVMRQQRVVLTAHRPDVELTVKGVRGEAALNESVYAPVLDLMADHRPRTVQEIEEATALPLNRTAVAMNVLIGMGHALPAQDPEASAAARPAADRLNAYLMDLSRSSSQVGFLVSPVSGGGYPVHRFPQLFLAARERGLQTPQEWAHDIWMLAESQQVRLLKDNKPIETEEEGLAEMNRLAEQFAEKELPTLLALQVA